MSSFVIEKSEYMKAAGFIAGLAEQKNFYRENLIYLWNRREGRVYTDTDWITSFNQCFLNNAESVKRQYDDKEAQADNNEYIKEFLEAKKKAAKLYNDFTFGDREGLTKAIYDFHQFTCGVSYQIEDEKLQFFTMSFLNEVNAKLIGVLASNYESECWGSFAI